jgi:excinuclease ABC subunit C
LTPGIESGHSTPTEYKKDLRQLIRYLKGGRKQLLKEIERDMKRAAKQHDFETAARRRNQLRNLNELRRQMVFSRQEFLDASKDEALSGLKKLLDLKNIPQRIEAYDVSHISGTNNVASLVVATNGVADRREYRKFKLRTGGNDDYAHMRETIERRLKHLGDWGRPDLIIIDGGVGQLGAVADLLSAAEIPFIGRNKSGDHSRNAPVQIVFAGAAPAKNPGIASSELAMGSAKYQTIELKNDDHIAKLIARLDDESHRFAISYHQSLRTKGQTKNALEDIPGIGPVTRKKLIRSLGSVSKIRAASQDEIASIVGQAKAQLIKQHLS